MAADPAESHEERGRGGPWLIAVISAGSALLGALVGATSGYFIAERQISAAHEVMLREERKETYVAATAALSRLQDALAEAEALPQDSEAADTDAIVCPVYDSTRTTLLSVYLLGDEKTTDYAGDALGIAAKSCTTAPHQETTEADDDPWEQDFGYAFLGFVSAAQEELAKH